MTLRNRIALWASLAAVAALVPAASFAEGVTRRASAVQGHVQVQLDDVDQIRRDLITTQRSIREGLAAASLTTDQLTEAYGLFQSFTNNYVELVLADNPMVSEMSFDEIYEGKVAAQLRARFALTAGETDYLRDRLSQWVNGELVIRDSVRDDLQGGR